MRGLAALLALVLTIAPALAQWPPNSGGSQMPNIVGLSGSGTPGDCAKWVASNELGDAGAGCGGSGSPGGTAGQVQFNNTGSFGGFTVGGDGTLNTSTGALAVTKSGGVAFGSAAFASTGTAGATLGLLNTANTYSAAQTFSALTLTGASGCATFTAGVLGSTGAACGGGGGSGTVTSASVVTANGVSATVANPTTTPAFTFTLGAITPTSVNGNTVPTAADTVALLAATQTLSNKTFVAPALGTPASAVLTNATGTAAGLTAGHVTTNASSTGDVTSVGNVTTYGNVVPAAKGGAGTVTGALKGNGAGVVSQAACADLSNAGTACAAAVGTSGATLGLLNTANTYSAAQTYSAITLTGGSGCATFTAGVLGSTGAACGGAGTTPGGTSGQIQYNNAGSFGGFTTSGDLAIVPSTGIATLASTAVTPGSYTNSSVTVDAKGRVTAASSGTAAPSAANPTGTAGPTANNGSATTFMRSDGTPAVQLGTNAVKGIVQVDGTTITAASGVISAAHNGTVTSVASGCGTSTGGSPITSTGTLSAAVTRRVNTTTSDPIVSTDCGNIVAENNAASIAVSIAQAGTTGFANGTYFEVCNIGAGTATITPTTSTIGGAANYALPGGTAAAPKCVGIQSDGTNYNVVPDWFAVGALATITPGTGVATAAANNLSAAGGLASTVASGTSAMGTSAIASGACATAVTTTATGTATTDVVTASFNGDPTAVTGYLPSTSGGLSIFPYPTSGNVNFKVCNPTGASITPGALTLNWRVVR